MTAGLSPERFAGLGEVCLRHQTSGDPEASTKVLVTAGVGFPLEHWSEGFCRSLAGRGVVDSAHLVGGGRTSLTGHRHPLGRRPRSQEEDVERRVRSCASVGSTGGERDVDEIRQATQRASQRGPGAPAGQRRRRRAVRAAARGRSEAGTRNAPSSGSGGERPS